MSGSLSTVITSVASLLLSPPRAIGLIIPDVVIEESHADDLIVTEHPVEAGAPISDHAFRRPAELKIRAGWSNAEGFSIDEGRVSDIYAQLIELQRSRVPFGVTTGKRRYENMMLVSLQTSTDSRSEYSLFVTAILREVIITSALRVTLAPQERHAVQQDTAPTQDTGVRSPVARPNTSALASFFSFVGVTR